MYRRQVQKEIEKRFRETRHLYKTKKFQKIYSRVIFLPGWHQRFKCKSNDMYEKIIIKIYHTLTQLQEKAISIILQIWIFFKIEFFHTNRYELYLTICFSSNIRCLKRATVSLTVTGSLIFITVGKLKNEYFSRSKDRIINNIFLIVNKRRNIYT